MSIPLNAQGADTLLRLSGLKHAGGKRKVMPEDEAFSEGMNYQDTSAPELPNYSSDANLPTPDTGMGASPQSYDVRANTVGVPEQEDDNSEFFHRIGHALHGYMTNNKTVDQAPPIETAQVDEQEGLPPVTASEQESGFPLFNRDGMYMHAGLTPISKKPEISKEAPVRNENARFLSDEYIGNLWRDQNDKFRTDYPEIARTLPEHQSFFENQDRIEKASFDAAQQAPWEVAVYGATDAFSKKPELVQDFQEYTGINFDEMQKEMTERYEKALSDIESGLLEQDANDDEQTNRIKERIIANQSTDADKFYIGLALMMPLILGGMFGKEAGIGALGGAAKGISESLGKKAENIRKDEDLLNDISKLKSERALKKGEIELERAKFPSEMRKNLPKDEFEDLKGMKIHTFKDPETGEVTASGPEILPGFYADLQYANTPEKRKELRQEASKLSHEKAALNRADEATSDVIKAAMQLKDPGIFGKILAYSLSEDKNGALKKFVDQMAPEIEIDGRKQNSAVYINSKIEQMKDAYRRNENMKAFTQTIANHIESMLANPQYSGLKPQDLIDQILTMRDRSQQFFVDRAHGQGFLREPLESELGKKNRDLFKKMNRKEEKSQIERDKEKIIGNRAGNAFGSGGQ